MDIICIATNCMWIKNFCYSRSSIDLANIGFTVCRLKISAIADYLTNRLE